MTRIRLKGLNVRRKRLADGRLVEYWNIKGIPDSRLPGKPGSAEFMARYTALMTTAKPRVEAELLGLLNAYQKSADFKGLAASTRDSYVLHIREIEKNFADFPLAALDDPQSRAMFLQWRDEIAERTPRTADLRVKVLARVLAWSKGRGLIKTNPLERIGLMHRANRSEFIWRMEDETAFYTHAPQHLHLPLLLALWTGQRRADLLRLTWGQYDGETLRLTQQKTGRRIVITVGAPLRAVLDARQGGKKPGETILVNSKGAAWTDYGFSASWRKACVVAGVTGLTFHDLRGTAVTRLAVAGATEQMIAQITGHSTQNVRSIMDVHYLSRDPALGKEAIRRLEESGKFPTVFPTRA